ncbi:MAG: hypothetical protein COB61_005795 [Thiotrichales bacterium]|nr:hypothetical protein [Thiotrichales bacterium]
MSGSIQDSYGKRAKGFKGGLANSNPTTEKNAVAGMALAIGTFVKASATGLVDLTAITDNVDGVVLKSTALDTVTVQAGSSVTLAKRASVFMECETACVEGETVHVRFIVGAGSEPVGNVRNVADGVTTAVVNATFAETLTSAGLVEIELNL